jgi:tetratricopeptide (TPR) repeat protein
MLPTPEQRADTEQRWIHEHVRQLNWKLERTIDLIGSSVPSDLRLHGRSYLALVNESQRYPQLTSTVLEMIARLHPLPVRWGWGNSWEAQLRFALEHSPAENIPLQAEYRCGLADVYLPVGRFDDAVHQAKIVLAMPGVPVVQAARAARTLFTCFRSTGRHALADELMEDTRTRFLGYLPAVQVPAESAQAWLIFNQSRLEQLRELGKIDEGLALVDQMIQFDQHEGSLNPLLTPDLVTHRSTLLWNQARYAESVADLMGAIDAYQQGGDPFNAESLQSNLGLVYWTMGELDLAEQTLTRAIQYYRKTAADQLITYDLGNLGLTYFARGNLPEALQLTEEHIAHARRLNFISEANRGRRNLGTILVYLGRIEESIAELTVGNIYFQKRGSRYGYQLDFLWLARCYQAQGDTQRAISETYKVLAWCDEHKPMVLHQLTLRCLADFLPLEEQEPLLMHSLSMARKLNRQLEEAAVLLLFGRAAHDRQFGQQCWQTGVAIMQKQGAGAWLEGRSLENPPLYPMFL